jgi:hypothetical protein
LITAYNVIGEYSPSVLAFLVGGLAGFQGIYNKYGQASLRLAAKPMGVLYFATRGIVPAALFCISLGHGPNIPPWTLALGLGASTELFLRMKFYIKDSDKSKDSDKDAVGQLLIGPFNLLTFYQGLFLDALAQDLQDIRKEVEKLIPGHLNFDAFCDLIESRLNIIVDPAVKAGIIKILTTQRTDYSSKPSLPNKDTVFKRYVGYQLMEITSKRVILQLIE